MDFTEIIKALLGLLVAVITTVIAPTVKTFLASRVEREKLDKWRQYVEIAVAAAEQTIPKTMTQEKKEFVFDWLKARGIEFDAEEVDSMIEAAVIRLHNELKGAGE